MSKEKVERYCYIYSCDLSEDLQIKIGSLEGHHFMKSDYALWKTPEETLASFDLIVTCEVVSGDQQLTLPVQTAYKSFTNRLNWQEWLTLPIAYSYLPRNAELIFKIYGMNKLGQKFLCGETSTPVFDKYGTVQKGMLDLKVEAYTANKDDPNEVTADSGTVKFLSELTKKHREGRIEKVDWLDRLTFREIELINERHKKVSKLMYLMIEFPEVFFKETRFDIVYFEENGDMACPYMTKSSIIQFHDSTLSMDNLVEVKHHSLARTLRSGTSDRDLKPDPETRNALNNILSYPPNQILSSEEQDQLWRYRYFLSSQKMALSKFLKCVSWNNAKESHEALELMHSWDPINVEDSLELLSSTFTEPAVRQYAVGRLMQADDEDLLLYLLQLVQAVRYEDITKVSTALVEQAVTPGVTQDVLNEALADDSDQDSAAAAALAESVTTPVIPDTDDPSDISEDLMNSSIQDTPQPGEMDLVSFLIYRASNNYLLANYLYWYLHVETEESPAQSEKSNEIFCVMLHRFIHSLRKTNPSFYNKLQTQQKFMGKLLLIIQDITKAKLDRKKKIEQLQSLISNSETKDFTFTSFEPFPHPLDPNRLVKGIIPESAFLFKSALCPARLTFLTTAEEQYTIIFKHGDDLRQDQLVLQMVHLMDRLLRKENLDLKLKPYRVLATSSKHGFIEHVASQALAAIQEEDGSILNYLKKHAPADTPTGVSTEVMDTYIRSCAGYCVITYLLGVGDRHLDNLMLTPSGHLFHIDFGFILGRDPKPMPPPMKLTKEMVEAMGGPGSEQYKMFTDLCFSAFFHLRRSANLILNLFSLMIDANIPDIVLEPDKTVKKVQDKFLLNLSDEEAAKEMHGLLEVSVNALMPAIAETFHRIAQLMKK